MDIDEQTKELIEAAEGVADHLYDVLVILTSVVYSEGKPNPPTIRRLRAAIAKVREAGS